MPPKVLFLNPPGKKLYIRDYYCSKVSKAYYLPQPVDLLMQTGYFAEKGCKILLVDAIVDRLSFRAAFNRVIAFAPDLIITQCGAVSFEEDKRFLQAVKNKRPKTGILASGDLFLENPQKFLAENSWLDGVITNWFGDSSVRFFDGSFEQAAGIVSRTGGGNGHAQISAHATYHTIPRPRHELFLKKRYRYPFATGYPMATVLTSYACPYPCTFCIMSKLGFARRRTADILDELRFIKISGVRYLYFSDQTFYVLEDQTDEILDFMLKEWPGIRWCCFSRVDRLDESKMRRMKRAGCNVVMFGVEWAEDALSEKYRKNYSSDQVKETFAIAKRVGLKTMGTFLLGVPGQSAESIQKTIDFAIALQADYASFNIAVPRAQTSFREQALSQGLISAEDKTMDQSGSFITMGTGVLSAERISMLKKEAYRRFYLRPHYLLNRLLRIRTYQELKTHLWEGAYVLKGLF
jgi:pyruvate-formate lyase-activating enzyme